MRRSFAPLENCPYPGRRTGKIQKISSGSSAKWTFFSSRQRKSFVCLPGRPFPSIDPFKSQQYAGYRILKGYHPVEKFYESLHDQKKGRFVSLGRSGNSGKFKFCHRDPKAASLFREFFPYER